MTRFSIVIHGKDGQPVNISRLTPLNELIETSIDMYEDGLYQESSWYMARASEAKKNGGFAWIKEESVFPDELSAQGRLAYERAMSSAGEFPRTVEFMESEDDIEEQAPVSQLSHRDL